MHDTARSQQDGARASARSHFKMQSLPLVVFDFEMHMATVFDVEN